MWRRWEGRFPVFKRAVRAACETGEMLSDVQKTQHQRLRHKLPPHPAIATEHVNITLRILLRLYRIVRLPQSV
jgi:hypothetical protein